MLCHFIAAPLTDRYFTHIRDHYIRKKKLKMGIIAHIKYIYSISSIMVFYNILYNIP